MSRTQIRFLIDEDTSHVIRDGLQHRQPEVEVRVIGGEGAPSIGAKDEEILDRETYILVSSNRSTMPVHLQAYLQKGGHIPGILLLRPSTSYRQIIDTLDNLVRKHVRRPSRSVDIYSVLIVRVGSKELTASCVGLSLQRRHETRRGRPF